MSAHSRKCKARHPSPSTYEREPFHVGHMLFDLCDHPVNGKTFALKVGDPLIAQNKPPLFSGHVERGMGTQLRRLAHRFDELEAMLAPSEKEGGENER